MTDTKATVTDADFGDKGYLVIKKGKKVFHKAMK